MNASHLSRSSANVQHSLCSHPCVRSAMLAAATSCGMVPCMDCLQVGMFSGDCLVVCPLVSDAGAEGCCMAVARVTMEGDVCKCDCRITSCREMIALFQK